VEWTALEQRLLVNANLARVAMEIGLDLHIIGAPGLARISAGMMATALEAIVGAAYLDGGDDAVNAVMRGLSLRVPEFHGPLGLATPANGGGVSV
jgi:ribonuclease III